MVSVAEKLVSACPLAVAALLLVARGVCERLGLPAPEVAQILAATQASRSAAYELGQALARLLPTLVRARGRPPKPAPEASSNQSAALTRAVLAYVMRHPGCVHRHDARQRYSDGFRRFVVAQRAEHAALEVEPFAAAIDIPLGTLKQWLREPMTTASSQPPRPPEPSEAASTMVARIETVLAAYARWSGGFVDFCDHVRRDLHLPFGRALVGRILEAHGRRRATRRAGRSPDELALRGAFRTFFPGAQWVGDGMAVPVVVDGQRFTFNVELDVDAHTAALVGGSVRDQEDAAAVVEALHDGVATTGAPPLALLLDNRPSNHTPEVDAALGDTLPIRATPGRGQNKAHVEGGFGLFSQRLPELVLDTRRGAHALAGALLRLVVQVWARTTNHRPRSDRGARSRVELYADQPTAQQIEQARRELRETAERQERARRTLEARRRPEVLALLDQHFARLALLDPQRHLRLAIARYPLDAIVAGLAIFGAKRRAGTLPDGADARYLLGIVRNVADKTEGEHLARGLLELRLEARDRALAPLLAARDAICSAHDVARVCSDCVDRALDTPSPLDRAFWLGALADVLRAQPDSERRALFLAAARRIQATYAVPPRERQDALRVLAQRVFPIA
jgi:hypothetical protein